MSVNPPNPPNQTKPNIEGLATLLVLQDEVKKLKNLTEFGFFTTNETHRLLPYHTGYLWQKSGFIDVHLIAQSGIAELDLHAPVNQWLKEEIHKIQNSDNAKKCHQIDYRNVDKTTWPESLPFMLLWCPLLDESDEVSGGLLLFRDLPFTDQEVKMLSWLMNNYQYTWLVLAKSKKISWIKLFKKKRHWQVTSVIILVIIFFPTRLSVVANATVVPKTPAYINAPIQGIIREFLVKPGEMVKAGQILILLEKRDLMNAVAVNQKKVLLTEAKLRTAINEGFNHKEAQSEVPILQAQLAVDKADLDFTNFELSKTTIITPIDGIAVFDNKEDWIGQPVQPGDTILSISDPNKVELKINLGVSDVIKLEVGGEGKFFLYGQLTSVPIRLKSLGYNAKITPNKVLAYQLIADFSDSDNVPRLGAQGTVRLYGNYVPFIYYIVRRPIQAFRQTLGI